MKEILYTDFKGIDSLISGMLGENEILQKAMKRANLYAFWSKVVGKPFDTKSKPYGMAGKSTMIIACENAAVVQELSLRKKQIIKKYAPYVKPLKITLEDIIFDVKRWRSVNTD
ncbi:MAG: DUF721 domain-containing protein [Candidatus Gastranaerophilales bacterium]|nr:DUF721 domain-containing protein [Candidatus Gastranaerophilales bacterium]